MAELVWPGKYVDGVRSLPEVSDARLQPRWRWGKDDPAPHRLIEGDNRLALDALLAELRGKIDLVYIDPPFATGGKFNVATRVGLPRGGRPPPEIDAPAYSDRFEGGPDGFLAMLDVRLRRIHELLAPQGSFYLHVDPTVGHAVKVLCDEVFGASSFQREIVWRIGWVSGFKTRAKNWIRNHDLIFFYTKDPQRFTFNKHYVPYPEGYTRRDGSPPKGQGMPIDDVWNANETEFSLRGRDSLDSIQIKSFSGEKSGYATQKNASLLRRIIEASSNPGDLVLDAFCGSGTTGVAAAELGRRFIGCDVNPLAIHIATKRLLGAAAEEGLCVSSVQAAGEVTKSADESGGLGEPVVALDVAEHEDGLELVLEDYSYPPDVELPAKLRALDPRGLDLVDAWWASADGEGEPRTVVAESYRTHQQRELRARLVVPRAPALFVHITDVMYQTIGLALDIDEAGAKPRIASVTVSR